MKMKIKKLPTLLFQGFLALLPLIITLYIANKVFRFIEGIVDNILPLFPDSLNQDLLFIIAVELAAILIVLFLIVLVGMIVRSVIGRWFLKLLQSFFSFIPGLNVVYRATEQVVSIVSNEKKSFFRHPVLVEYPSPGIWAIGFRTGEFEEASFNSDQKRYTVFIPTTPNPTSGFLAVIPEDRLKELEMSAEDAIKLILSGGIIRRPGLIKKVNKPV